jgi:hypothetical protein
MAFGKMGSMAGLTPPAPTPVNAFSGAQRPAGVGGMGGMGATAPMAAPTTTSLDLPQNLASLIAGGPQVTVNEQAIQPLQTGTVGSNPNASVLDFRMQPTYADGGMVGAGGMPDMTGMGGGMGGGMPNMAGLGGGSGLSQQGAASPVTPQMIEMQINEFLRNNPQDVAELKQVVQYLIQTGELTADEMNLAGQLAMTALQNPDLYPNLRQFAIQQGLAGENELSQEYDQGLIFALLLAIRAVQSEGGATSGNALQAEPPMMSMADGGYVTMGENAKDGGPVAGPGTSRSDSIPIRVSTGEYVIPAHIVKMKGKEFFDGMLEKYKDAV